MSRKYDSRSLGAIGRKFKLETEGPGDPLILSQPTTKEGLVVESVTRAYILLAYFLRVHPDFKNFTFANVYEVVADSFLHKGQAKTEATAQLLDHCKRTSFAQLNGQEGEVTLKSMYDLTYPSGEQNFFDIFQVFSNGKDKVYEDLKIRRPQMLAIAKPAERICCELRSLWLLGNRDDSVMPKASTHPADFIVFTQSGKPRIFEIKYSGDNKYNYGGRLMEAFWLYQAAGQINIGNVDNDPLYIDLENRWKPFDKSKGVAYYWFMKHKKLDPVSVQLPQSDFEKAKAMIRKYPLQRRSWG